MPSYQHILWGLVEFGFGLGFLWGINFPILVMQIGLIIGELTMEVLLGIPLRL